MPYVHYDDGSVVWMTNDKAHEAGAVYMPSGIWRITSSLHTPPYTPISQKVKGLRALIGYLPSVGINAVIKAAEGMEGKVKGVPYPTFARPCPVRPRHGFVESRVVEDKDGLVKVCKETFEADPEGEVMCCSPIDAVYNAVWVPSLLTVGKGNDGATSGKDVVTFPLSGKVWGLPILANAGVGKDEDPYIEVVYPSGSEYYATQLRAGPKLTSTSPDYIPHTAVVERVIKVDPSMSLLAWEELVKGLEGEKGVVVYHPGGSPTDHFSVHARTFEIPVLTTFEPFVGQKLQEVGAPKMDVEAVLRGVVVADNLPLSFNNNDPTQAVNLLLHSLHCSGAFGGRDGLWFGVGVGLMMRLGAVALRGEARHLRHVAGLDQGRRDLVYKRIVNFPLQKMRASLPRTYNALRWGNFGGAVGGAPWARCGKATVELFDAVGALAREKDDASLNELIRTFNRAVNQAHHNGWWLNKFAPSGLFKEVQIGAVKHTLSLAPFLWKVHEVDEGLKGVNAAINKLAAWQSIKLTHPRLIKAEVELVPGTGQMMIKVEDRLLRKLHKPIPAPMPELIKEILPLLGGKLYLSVGDEGLALTLETTHNDPVVVWKEA